VPEFQRFCLFFKAPEKAASLIRSERNFRARRPKNGPGCRDTCMARSRTRKRQSTRRTDLDFAFSARHNTHTLLFGTKQE
ncbi:MAG: hypothetical protein OXJ64_09940, partial [Boseongicola sp.]|nr:hypothetical protein [Boseongicola sp.]